MIKSYVQAVEAAESSEREGEATPAPAEVDLSGELTTVAIPARNEERFIGPCLDSVLSQDHRSLQVIVVDGASTDRTADIVRSYIARDSRVELVHNPRAIVPTSLNLALSQARGRWFVRIDAHATVGPDYVSTAVGELRTGRWAAVGGRVHGVGATPAGRAVSAAMESRFGIGDSILHYGERPEATDHVPFPAYPTEHVREIGGWDETLPVNQDFELDYRLMQSGRQLLYDPRLVISYHGQQTIKGVFRQFLRYGRGKAQVALMHPSSLRLRHFAAPALVAWLLGAAASIPWRPYLSLALVAPYAAALSVASLITARKLESPSARVRLPAAFAAMHVGWGLGFWKGLAGSLVDRVRRRRTQPA